MSKAFDEGLLFIASFGIREVNFGSSSSPYSTLEHLLCKE